MSVAHVTRYADVLRCYIMQVFLLRVYTCEMIIYCDNLETEVWCVCVWRQANKCLMQCKALITTKSGACGGVVVKALATNRQFEGSIPDGVILPVALGPWGRISL
jgi:hypothetical protein